MANYLQSRLPNPTVSRNDDLYWFRPSSKRKLYEH